MKTISYSLPSHWLSALFNDDLTGYDREELEAIEGFVGELVDRHGSAFAVSSTEAGFMQWHSARAWSPYASDCHYVTFDVETP